MEFLPNEILIIILNQLNIDELFIVRQVHTRLFHCIDDPQFYLKWQSVFDMHNSSMNKYPPRLTGFYAFYLWFHKYVLYRYNCMRHSYGLLDTEIRESNNYTMTMYKMYEFLDALSKHDDTLVQYIQTVTELLIGFDIASIIEQCDNDINPFWELIYGYIAMHQRSVGGDCKLLDNFKDKFYTGSEMIVKYRDV